MLPDFDSAFCNMYEKVNAVRNTDSALYVHYKPPHSGCIPSLSLAAFPFVLTLVSSYRVSLDAYAYGFAFSGGENIMPRTFARGGEGMFS